MGYRGLRRWGEIHAKHLTEQPHHSVMLNEKKAPDGAPRPKRRKTHEEDRPSEQVGPGTLRGSPAQRVCNPQSLRVLFVPVSHCVHRSPGDPQKSKARTEGKHTDNVIRLNESSAGRTVLPALASRRRLGSLTGIHRASGASARVLPPRGRACGTAGPARSKKTASWERGRRFSTRVRSEHRHVSTSSREKKPRFVTGASTTVA